MTVPEEVERWYLALTVWGEARGLGTFGMLSVGWVIRNRRDDPRGRWPRTVVEVVTQRRRVGGRVVYQFSCWDPVGPNRARFADPMGTAPADRRAFVDALGVAERILSAEPDRNPIPGVCWYHDRTIDPPQWTEGLEEVVVAGEGWARAHPAFRYYRDKEKVR